MADAVRGDDRARDDDGRASARPRRRARHQARRSRTVRFALTDEEYAEVSAAARQAGLARGAYAAEATLAIARGAVTAPDVPLADAVHALDRAALGVRRIGVNLNQAVAKLNATGQWSGDLPAYAEEIGAPRGPAGGGRGRPAEASPPDRPRARATPPAGRRRIRGPVRRSRMTGWRSAPARHGADGLPRVRDRDGWRSAWSGTRPGVPMDGRVSGDER